MFKTVGIYKKMDNIREFEEFYISEFMPRMLQLPGVLEMKINKVMPTQLPNQDPGLQEIELIVETYYKSPETIKHLMATKEGKELADLLISKGQGNLERLLHRNTALKVQREYRKKRKRFMTKRGRGDFRLRISFLQQRRGNSPLHPLRPQPADKISAKRLRPPGVPLGRRKRMLHRISPSYLSLSAVS